MQAPSAPDASVMLKDKLSDAARQVSSNLDETRSYFIAGMLAS